MKIPCGKDFETAVSIIKTLREAGFSAYLAGGCVRDMIMGAQAHDYDIATDARPELVEKLFPRTVAVGKKFGVVIVVKEGFEYEVAAFRSDIGYSDGRRPDEVVFTCAREDALRRDFTINALFFDPVENKVLDFVNGQRDIQKKIIRCVGDPRKRFAEDYLRMIRAVRFAVRFDFELDTGAAEAIKEHAHLISSISSERIKEELDKMLLGPRPGAAVRMLFETGLLAVILPEVAAMAGVEQPPEFHPEGDVFEHTVIMLDKMVNPNLELAYSVLFHDIGKPCTISYDSDRIRFNYHDKMGSKIVESVCDRLRFPRGLKECVAHIVSNHMRFMHVKQMRPARLKRMIAHPAFPVELELHRLDCLASHGDLSNAVFLEQAVREFEEQKKTITEPLITGGDLIAKGYKPGPLFKDILTAVEDARLESLINTREQALAFVEARYPKQG